MSSFAADLASSSQLIHKHLEFKSDGKDDYDQADRADGAAQVSADLETDVIRVYL